VGKKYSDASIFAAMGRNSVKETLMYTWIKLNSPADLARLENELSAEYEPAVVAQKLADGISDAVKGVLIERD